MHVTVIPWPAPAAYAVREVQFLDGARDVHRSDGDVWRYEPSDRLAEILHRDGASTVFDAGGGTFYFDADGDLVWSHDPARLDEAA